MERKQIVRFVPATTTSIGIQSTTAMRVPASASSVSTTHMVQIAKPANLVTMVTLLRRKKAIASVSSGPIEDISGKLQTVVIE